MELSLQTFSVHNFKQWNVAFLKIFFYKKTKTVKAVVAKCSKNGKIVHDHLKS